MGYAVLHINKGGKSAKGLGNHNDRQKDVLNADPQKRGENLHVVPTLDEKGNPKFIIKKFANFTPEKDLQTRINDRIKEGYTGKKEIRQDAVKHLDIILTGSHTEMKAIEKDPEKLKTWIADNHRFIRDTFGRENLVGFAVHLDERTPHIHATVVPLTPDGRLSAKEMMGDRKKLQKLQTDYAVKMQPYGLERGIEGSTAVHTTTKEFYARLEAEKAQFDNIPSLEPIEKLQGNFVGMVNAEKANEKITHLEAILKAQNQKLIQTTKIIKTLSKEPEMWQKRNVSYLNQLTKTKNNEKSWIKNADLILEGKADKTKAREVLNREMIRLGLKEPEKKAEEIKKPILNPKNKDFGIS
jgi:Plasmid recombination enzyme